MIRSKSISKSCLMLYCSRSFIDSLADGLSNIGPCRSAGVLWFPILSLLAATFTTATNSVSKTQTPLLLCYTIVTNLTTISSLFHSTMILGTAAVAVTVTVTDSIFSTFFPISKEQEKVIPFPLKLRSMTYCWFTEKFHIFCAVIGIGLGQPLGRIASAIRLPNNGSRSLSFRSRRVTESFWWALYAIYIAVIKSRDVLPMPITVTRWYAFFLLLNPTLLRYIWISFLPTPVNGAALLFRHHADWIPSIKGLRMLVLLPAMGCCIGWTKMMERSKALSCSIHSTKHMDAAILIRPVTFALETSSTLECSKGVSGYSKSLFFITIFLFGNSRITIMQENGVWNTKFTSRTWFQSTPILWR